MNRLRNTLIIASIVVATVAVGGLAWAISEIARGQLPREEG